MRLPRPRSLIYLAALSFGVDVFNNGSDQIHKVSEITFVLSALTQHYIRHRPYFS